MIKVLDKTFAILEEIIRETPNPVTPLEVAERLDLNRATCSRIIKMLLDSGYLLQISRKSGYVAGPRILTLNNMAAFQSRLMKTAVPIIDRVAKEIGDSAMLSQIYQNERYVLYLKNCNPKKEIRLNHLSYADIYNTASGVVEMAHRNEKEQLAMYDSMPDTARKWLLPEFNDRKNVLSSFHLIKRNGFYHTDRGDLGIFAFPVFRNRKFLASFGCSVEIEKYTERNINTLLKIGTGAAKEISSALSSTEYIG